MGDVRTAIVSGASSGIGAATATAMGARGWRVAIGARREDRLAEVADAVTAAGGHAFAHPLDVTAATSLDRFVAAAHEALGPPDVLVNNAGANRPVRIADAADDDLRHDVEVNLVGAMTLTRRVLPGMLERGRGDVVFVGSDGAPRPRPFQAAYNAAKAGLEAFARVLEMETEHTGVRSLLVRVGPASSEFGNDMPEARVREMLDAWRYWGVLRDLNMMSAEAVARAILRSLEIPPDESYPTVLEIQPPARKKETP